MDYDNEEELTAEEEKELILKNPVWDSVAEALASADSMAWDDCHKIYIHMDKEQTEESKTHGFDPVAPDLDVIKDWFVRSCGLSFISSIRTAQEGETWDDGYTQIIPQIFDFNLTPDGNEKEMSEFIREMEEKLL